MLFRKENMRKLLRTNKPEQSLVSYLAHYSRLEIILMRTISRCRIVVLTLLITNIYIPVHVHVSLDNLHVA